jgi:hypothetical protein
MTWDAAADPASPRSRGARSPGLGPGPGRGPGPGIDVDRSEALLAEHLSAAVRRFGAAVLGLVDLPSIETARPSRAELNVAAVLAWARGVDDAGLLETIEALADGVATGTLPLALTGPVVRKLMQWRRTRDQFSLEERRAIYDRVLGEVEPLMSHFVTTLAEIGQAGTTQSIRHLQIRASHTGLELAGELTARATGIAAFAARDIVRQVREALAILGDAELAQALGGGNPWTIVGRHAQSLLGRRVDPAAGRTRAMAGRELIEWLGRNADALVAGTAAPTAADPVVHAALALLTGLG